MNVETIKRHIDELFSDTSRKPSATRADLEEIMEHVGEKIDALQDDSGDSDDE